MIRLKDILLETEEKYIILLGVVDTNGVRVIKARNKQQAHPFDMRYGERWRYDNHEQNIWWWLTPDADDKLAVEDWLESRGYPFKRHKSMFNTGDVDSLQGTFLESVGGKNIVVGITSGDGEGVFGSDKVPNHAELYARFYPKVSPNETEKELLTSYSKFDNRLYKSMKAVTEAWYENPTISRDEALAIVRKVVQL